MRFLALALAVVGLAGCGDARPTPAGPAVESMVVIDLEVGRFPGRSPTAARDLALTALRERLDRSGLAQAAVTATGPDGIQVTLAGDTAALTGYPALLVQGGVFGVHRVAHDHPVLAALRGALARAPDAAGRQIAVATEEWSLPGGGGGFAASTYLTAPDPVVLAAWVAEATTVDPAAAMPPGYRMAVEDLGSPGPARWRSHLIEEVPVITGADVQAVELTVEPASDRTAVVVTLDRRGAERFAEVTAETVGKKLAIVLDGRVLMAPVVQMTIPGGQLQVSMGAGDPATVRRDAEALAAAVRAATLPPLRVLRTRTVGGPR